MSALPLRRALLLIVPLALAFGACGEGTETVVPMEPIEAALPHCTAEQVQAVMPCWDAGSTCSATGGAFIPWIDPGPMAPEITWTYPCVPDHFSVSLSGPSGAGPSETLASGQIRGDAPGGLTYSWIPDVSLPREGRYSYGITAYEGGSQFHGWFDILTSVLCQDLPDSPPYLRFPEDGDVFVTPEEFTEGFEPSGGLVFGFSWSTECRYYEGQVSTDSTFATGVMPIVTDFPVDTYGGIVGGVVEWCHTYFWRVRAYTDDAQGPWAEPSSFRIVPPGGEDQCRSLLLIEAVAVEDSACRVGPSTAYGIAGYAAAGERRMIVGRNAGGTWFQTAEGCYINNKLLRVEGVQGTPFLDGAAVEDLLSLIPVVPDPPLPTATIPREAPSGPGRPSCSSSLSTKDACEAAGGTWTPGTQGWHCVCP